MRKIEQSMCDALKQGKPFKQNNTNILIVGKSIKVYLHGNLIATINTKLKNVYVSNCGWQSNTTKSRINAIAKCFGCAKVSQTNSNWFVAGVPFSKYNDFKKPLPKI